MLFDQIKQSYSGCRLYAEPIFDYLNRSARVESQRVRDLLEKWFKKFPPEAKEELRNCLRSSDQGFLSAFFELYLYNLLSQLGFEAKIHPNIPGKNTHPDFKVLKNGKPIFYLEATLVMPSKEEMSSQARENQIYDILDKKVKSPDFFIGVEIISRS